MLHISRLQSCVEVLCVLSSVGPLRLRQIRRRVKLDKPLLVEHLGFLVDRGLVEKQNLGKYKQAYGVTVRGLSVLKVLAPLVREAQRIEVQNFEAISSALGEAKFSSEKKHRWKLSDFIKVEIVEEEIMQTQVWLHSLTGFGCVCSFFNIEK